MYYFDYEEPVFRPPSEAQSLIFQITVGCSQNHCTFCGMYKMKQFRMRSVDEIREEVSAVPMHHRPYIRRVFLADGDALVYPQKGLLEILELLASAFPDLNRIGMYASPNSLTTKSEEELAVLRSKKVRIFYFGLESGDAQTLKAINKGYSPQQMLELCQKAHRGGMKLSITAILGLAGRQRSAEHAAATAEWINALSPKYFSLLTMFRRHNDDFLRSIEPLNRGEILEETLAMLERLEPKGTILRSNHVSNFLNLAGSYPKDRHNLIETAKAALAEARLHPDWFNVVPDYQEDYF